MFEWYVLFEAGQQLRLDVVSGVLRFLFYSSTMITYASAKQARKSKTNLDNGYPHTAIITKTPEYECSAVLGHPLSRSFVNTAFPRYKRTI